MASIYVSYRSTEAPFVRAVMSKLEARHQILIDYNMPAGVDWRTHQLSELRSADVFVVFISHDTHASDLQNAEIGSAITWSALVDGKRILPILLDDVPPPRSIGYLDCLSFTHRDVDRSAQELEETLRGGRPRIRVFISHAHVDVELATRLVDVFTANFEVPDGELRCTSVPGHQLDLGAMAPEALRRELGSAACVVGLLTPNSLSNEWVLFELGAVWLNAAKFIPLLAGGLSDREIPGPFRGAAGGELERPITLDRMIDQLERSLPWKRRQGNAAREKCYQLAEYVQRHPFTQTVEAELRASFSAKRTKLGSKQGALLDQITSKLAKREHLSLPEIARLADSKSDVELYYRLEQLRLLGFLARIKLGEVAGKPEYGWRLTPCYRREIGR